MNRTRTIFIGLLSMLVLVWGLWTAFKWTAMRVYVAPNEALVVISKFGDPLPSDLVVVPIDNKNAKGVHEEVRGPGRYFLNPVLFDHRIVPIVEISAGSPEKWTFREDGNLANPATAPQIGLVTLKQGQTPPPGIEVVQAGQKGIQKDVLTPGTYKINPFLYDVKLEPAIVIPPGSVGVVTRLSGDMGNVASATLTEIRAATSGPATQPTDNARTPAQSRLVLGATQRGILWDPLESTCRHASLSIL